MVSDIHEFSHNSISFNWDVQDAAKIFVSVNCLSTDFSAQKGIKVRQRFSYQHIYKLASTKCLNLDCKIYEGLKLF